MADLEKRAKRYPTDLTDAEWEIIRPFLPEPPKRGRTPSTDLREVLNALRYLARSSGGWRMLPKDFPPWQTVYWWFRSFVRRLLFRTIRYVALMLDREREAREQSPSAAAYRDFTVGIMRRSGDVSGFKVLPRRWVVERTFGSMTAGADCYATMRSASTCRRQ